MNGETDAFKGETDTFSFGFHTDPGPRETNQDTVLSIALPERRWLLAVADGMGGLVEGELASKEALKTLYQSLLEGNTLVESIQNANSAVFELADGRTMGTTLVAAVLQGTVAEVANVGDSRAYQLDPFGLVQITRDHTVGEKAPDGLNAPALDAASARWAGALARFIGAEETVDVDVFEPLHVHEGGWILLSSDGLHDVLSTSDMESALKDVSSPQEVARDLVERALARDTPDNVSVALAFRPKTGRPETPNTETVFQSQSQPGREPEGSSLESEHTPQESNPSPDEPDGDTPAGARPEGRVQEVSDAWNPRQFVNRARHTGEAHQGTSLALRLSILVILLAVLLFVVFKWTVSPGTG